MKTEEKKSVEYEIEHNGGLSESFDRSKWPDLTPNYTPPDFEDDCIPAEHFFEEGRALLIQKMKKLYGISN